jgi:hypothetical protein
MEFCKIDPWRKLVGRPGASWARPVVVMAVAVVPAVPWNRRFEPLGI